MRTLTPDVMEKEEHIMKSRLALGAVIVSVGCATGATQTAVFPEQDPLTVTVLAADYAGIDVDGRDGRLRVTAGDGDSVRVRVTLSGRCTTSASRVVHSPASGARLRVRVEPSTKGVCDEEWTLEVPARFAVSGDLDRADVEVDGVSGGVDLDVGKGTLRITVPGGDLRAHVANGDVIAETSTDSHGSVRAESQVGDVHVSLFGGTVRHSNPPGPGDWVEIGGTGRDRIALKTTVGNIRLAIW